MNVSVATLAFVLIFIATSASAQNEVAPPSNLPTTMEERGAPIIGAMQASATANFQPSQLQQIETDVPTAQLSKIAQQPFSEEGTKTRSAQRCRNLPDACPRRSSRF